MSWFVRQPKMFAGATIFTKQVRTGTVVKHWKHCPSKIERWPDLAGTRQPVPNHVQTVHGSCKKYGAGMLHAVHGSNMFHQPGCSNEIFVAARAAISLVLSKLVITWRLPLIALEWHSLEVDQIKIC